MSEKQWLWYDDNSMTTQGAIADFDDALIQWFDEPGCACGDSVHQQSFADFMARGSRYLALPDDIRAEMRNAIEKALSNPESA